VGNLGQVRPRRASIPLGAISGRTVIVLKKVLGLLVIGFIVYYLLTAPAGAADAVSGAASAVIDAFGQVGIFVNELAS
jgi:hypothetical protein